MWLEFKQENMTIATMPGLKSASSNSGASGTGTGIRAPKFFQVESVTKIPPKVSQACAKLKEGGFKGWLAGGCVRDMIMNRIPKDWDIVTDAPLEKIRELFPEHLEVGAAFGIIKLKPSKEDDVQIDIAIFRREDGYSDRRHPDVVEAGDEQTDVARRDFTINAMYLDPSNKTAIDYVGGYKDISAKTLRTVGAPETRFSEDALRILRAVRFSAQLGFKIDRDTANALKKCSSFLKAISRERVREETFRLLSSQRPVMGLEALAQNSLWEHVFGTRRVSVPADLRQLRLSWTPTPLHWLCALGVTGLLGDPIKEPHDIVERLTEELRLSNLEKRILNRVFHVYKDSVRDSSDSTGRLCSPQDWVDLAREDKPLMDFVKSFIRRARGPTEKEKTDALALVDQSLRWGARPGAEKIWPQADDLIKEGFKPGPKLGNELKERQWKAFWTKPA